MYGMLESMFLLHACFCSLGTCPLLPLLGWLADLQRMAKEGCLPEDLIIK